MGFASLILALVLPLVCSFIVVLFAKKSGGVAFALGVIAALLSLKGWPGFPPSEASGWLLFILPAAVLVGRFSQGKSLVTFGLPLFGGVMFVLLGPMIRWHWEGTFATIGWFSLYFAGSVFLVTGVRSAFLGSRQWWPRIYLGLFMGALAVALAASGSLLLGQLAGAAALGLAPMLLMRKVALNGALLLPVGTLAAALLVMGLCYAELHPVVAIALMLAAWLPASKTQAAAVFEQSSEGVVA